VFDEMNQRLLEAVLLGQVSNKCVHQSNRISNTILFTTIQYNTLFLLFLQYNTIRSFYSFYNTIQYALSTIQYNTLFLQYNTIQYALSTLSTIQYNTLFLQYNTIRSFYSLLDDTLKDFRFPFQLFKKKIDTLKAFATCATGPYPKGIPHPKKNTLGAF
jgi:hypothetical protein